MTRAVGIPGSIPLLLCLLFATQCAWFIATQSLTYDEPIHMVSGLRSWRGGQFTNLNHPPLGRLLVAAPLAVTGTSVADLEALVHRRPSANPRPESWARLARPVSTLLGLALAVLLWSTARRAYSTGAANLALALFAFSPALIAHFSLATTDGIGTLTIFATAVQLIRWRARPDRRQTVLLGIVLGALLAAKFYTPPIFALALLWVLVLGPDGLHLRPRDWNWRPALQILAIACLTLWGLYFFHVSRITLALGRITADFLGHPTSVVAGVPVAFHGTLYVPAAEYVAGLLSQFHHNSVGHRSFFLGEVSSHGGWRFYFPVVILLKWPTAVLVLASVGAVLLLIRRPRIRLNAFVMGSFPVLFLGLAIFARLNLGERYILPAYPFVLLACAGIWEVARRRWVRALLLCALVALVADISRYAPDYLSYFNPLVRQDSSWMFLTDSNLDWGQGLIALRSYQSQHPDGPISLAYFGSVDPATYGIPYHSLRPNERTTGTVVVSASNLSGQFLSDPAGYRWLLRYPQTTILDHTLHVFEVPADTSSGRR